MNGVLPTDCMAKKCTHKKPPKMLYLEWVADANERHKRGEKQLRCPECLTYIWQSYYNK